MTLLLVSCGLIFLTLVLGLVLVKKVQFLLRTVAHQSYTQDMLNFNMLNLMLGELVRRERYEEAGRLAKIIEREKARLGIDPSNSI